VHRRRSRSQWPAAEPLLPHSRRPRDHGGEFGVEQAVDGLRVRYSLESEGDLELLEDVQWADWDREGRLLVATRSGRLQIRSPRSGGHDVVFDADLAELTPEPTPAPASAANW
jgi:hypothetical protein